MWRYGLTAQVPLYLGGRLAASIAVAALQADEAAALLQGGRWQARFNATSLDTAAQTLEAVTRAVDANLDALDETRRKVDLAVRLGKRPELDLLKLADEIADSQARRVTTAAGGVTPLSSDVSVDVTPTFYKVLAGFRVINAEYQMMLRGRSLRRVRRHTFLPSVAFCLLGVAHGAYAGTISGRVSDAEGTVALQGAVVELVETGRQIEAGQNGSYRFSDVAPGQYTLRVTHAGSQPHEATVTVSGDETVRADLTLGVGRAAEEVVVVGQRAMMASALARQRSSFTIESVLTRDAIGQFPDQNVAESTRRLTGVNVLNDQGEGRFIAVRGLDPNLNAASINGVRVPAPEADVRGVALDVIPSELIESIEIKKTLTPDMDADTIGASIEINTTRAFDRTEPFLSTKLEGSYNNLNEEASPKASIDFSYPFDERFGVAGGFSYYRRQTETDNIEPAGWAESDAGIAFFEEIDYRDYDVRRTRLGGSLSFDLRATDTTTLYARGLYSQFDDLEQRRRLVFVLDEEPASGANGTATFLSDDGTIEVRRDLKDRFETQRIQSYQIGGETFAGAWSFDYSAAYSHAREHEFRTQDPTRFVREFEEPGELAVTFDFTELTRTLFDVTAGQAAFSDAAGYAFDTLEGIDGLTEDEEWSFAVDAARDFVLQQSVFQLKFGGKARLRKKTNDIDLQVFDGFDGTYTLADATGSQTYRLANLSLDPTTGLDLVRAFNDANASSFELNQFDTDFESNAEDFTVDEDIYAGYLMGRYTTESVTLVGGVRVERTEDDVAGNLTDIAEEGAIRDGVVLAEDAISFSPIRSENGYTDLLPSASLRYEAADDVVLRAGVFKSVVRPNIGQIAPIFIVEENDEGEREGAFGNIELEPYRAWNLDFSAEWYFAPSAVVQVGGFYKTIENFIVAANFDAGDAPYMGVFNGVPFDEAEIPINGEDATVQGLEFNYQHALAMLPAPLDGLLVGFNYTYTDAEGDVDGRTIPLPASSKHNFNAMLGFEKGRVSVRFTAAFRDEFLDSLEGSPEEDRYVKDHLQIDLRARYTLAERFQVFADLVNLNNEPFVAFQRGPGRDRLLQFETYSWTAIAGIRATF